MTGKQARFLFSKWGPYYRGGNAAEAPGGQPGVAGASENNPRVAATAASAVAAVPLLAAASKETGERVAAQKLRRAIIRHRQWANQQGLSAEQEVRSAAAAAVGHEGPAVRPLRATLAGSTERDGYRFLQYRFHDAAGNHVGGVGVTVDPQGRAWAGGVPEKGLWSFVGMKPDEMRAMKEQLKQDAPAAKGIFGIRGARGAQVHRDLKPVEERAAARLAGLDAIAGKSAIHALYAKAGRAWVKRGYLRQVVLGGMQRAVGQLPLTKGAEAIGLTGQEALAYKGRTLAGSGGRLVFQETSLKRAAGKSLAGFAAYGAASLAYQRRQRELTGAGRNEEAAREKAGARVVVGGVAAVAGAKAIRRGVRAGIRIGSRLAKGAL